MTEIRYTPSVQLYRESGQALRFCHCYRLIYYFSFFMGSFIDAEGNEISRTKCEIYTRVMGYYRPVTQFNNGKKSEFYSRTCFNGETVGA